MDSNLLLKTVIWRLISFTLALICARIWFGDWSVSLFTVFITILMMIVYYMFETIWKHRK